MLLTPMNRGLDVVVRYTMTSNSQKVAEGQSELYLRLLGFNVEVIKDQEVKSQVLTANPSGYSNYSMTPNLNA